MPAVSSSYTADAHAQADGRRYVRELHTLDDGSVQQATYLAPAGWGDAEFSAQMTARVGRINEALADAEAAAILERD